MKFNDTDLQSDIMDLIQEREKYRILALKYKEALEKLQNRWNNVGAQNTTSYSIVKEALKSGGEDV